MYIAFDQPKAAFDKFCTLIKTKSGILSYSCTSLTNNQNKMRKGKLILGLLLLLSTISCVKEKADEIAKKATTFEDINVPENFDYSGTKTVTVSVKVTDPEVLTAYKYVVKIYDVNPSEGGKLLITGAVNTDDYTYSPTVTVPTGTTQVWVAIYLGSKLTHEGYQTL